MGTNNSKIIFEKNIEINNCEMKDIKKDNEAKMIESFSAHNNSLNEITKFLIIINLRTENPKIEDIEYTVATPISPNLLAVKILPITIVIVTKIRTK